MISVEEVSRWVEDDLALLPAHQADQARRLLVAPQQITLGPDQDEDYGLIVARSGSRVAYFDAIEDEFAIGEAVEGRIEPHGLYIEFRYAIQVLIDDDKGGA